MSVNVAHEQALRRLGPFGIAAVLERLPQVVAAMRGNESRGASNLVQPRLLRTDLSPLARVLAQPRVVVERLRWLDRFTFQLVALAAWHGGELRREDAVEAAGAELTDELEAAADRIAGYALGERETAWLALLPGIAERVGTPGMPVRDYAKQLRTDDLAVLLHNLDVGEVAPRKAERVDQLEAALRDPAVVTRALEEIPEPMRRLLELLISAGGIASLDEFFDDDDALLGALYRSFPVAPRGQRRYGGDRTPLHELTERGLLVVDPYADLVFVPPPISRSR